MKLPRYEVPKALQRFFFFFYIWKHLPAYKFGLSIGRGLAGITCRKFLLKNHLCLCFLFGEKVGTRPFPITKAFQGFFFFVFESAPPYTQVSFNS